MQHGGLSGTGAGPSPRASAPAAFSGGQRRRWRWRMWRRNARFELGVSPDVLALARFRSSDDVSLQPNAVFVHTIHHPISTPKEVRRGSVRRPLCGPRPPSRPGCTKTPDWVYENAGILTPRAESRLPEPSRDPDGAPPEPGVDVSALDLASAKRSVDGRENFRTGAARTGHPPAHRCLRGVQRGSEFHLGHPSRRKQLTHIRLA